MGIKVVILCGGLGTRLRDETEVKPKPMIEIGGRPILWHIMKIYSLGKLMELFIGEDNYCLVQIPSGVWNGFKGIGTTPALVANCATIPHDSKEILRLDPLSDNIPYNWSLEHK